MLVFLNPFCEYTFLPNPTNPKNTTVKPTVYSTTKIGHKFPKILLNSLYLKSFSLQPLFAIQNMKQKRKKFYFSPYLSVPCRNDGSKNEDIYQQTEHTNPASVIERINFDEAIIDSFY